MTVDMKRPSNSSTKKIRRIILGAIAVVSVAGASYEVFQLRPAAPSLDRATIWTDEVRPGAMLREVHGTGALVPEQIRWIPERLS
jgi:HlyD family secretion protein